RRVASVGRQTIFAESAIAVDTRQPEQHRPWKTLHAALVRFAPGQSNQISQPETVPTLRYLTVPASTQPVGEQASESQGNGGAHALGLGADRIEVNKPRLEERSSHRLQCLVHPPVQLDLVIQRAEDLGYGALFIDIRRNADCRLVKVIPVEPGDGGLVRVCE